MTQLGSHTAHDVTLVREATQSSRRRDSSGRGGSEPSARKRPPRKARVAKPRSGPRPNRNPDDRLRHIVSLLLILAGLLLFLALVSYSRLDQANADVGPGELAGLITNEPGISARANLTENWLGLIGAYLADFLINGTIGWFALIFPFLFGIWGAAVYVDRELDALWRKTVLAGGIAVCGAALLGTISAISWTPTLAYEWSGAVGTFVATILGGLIGSAGAFLLLTAGILVISLFLFDTDLGNIVERLKRVTAHLTAYTTATWGRLRTAFLERSTADRSAPAGRVQRRVRKSAAPAPGNEAQAEEDHEPAHMIRRVREANPEAPSAVPSPPPPTPTSLRNSVREAVVKPTPSHPAPSSEVVEPARARREDLRRPEPTADDPKETSRASTDDVMLERGGPTNIESEAAI